MCIRDSVVQCSHGSILCSRSAALVVRLTMLQLLTPTSYAPQSERGSQSILPLLFRPASRARYCLVHNVAKCDIDYVPSTGHARSYDTTSFARMACASFFRKPCRPRTRCPLLITAHGPRFLPHVPFCHALCSSTRAASSPPSPWNLRARPIFKAFIVLS